MEIGIINRDIIERKQEEFENKTKLKRIVNSFMLYLKENYGNEKIDKNAEKIAYDYFKSKNIKVKKIYFYDSEEESPEEDFVDKTLSIAFEEQSQIKVLYLKLVNDYKKDFNENTLYYRNVENKNMNLSLENIETEEKTNKRKYEYLLENFDNYNIKVAEVLEFKNILMDIYM